MGLYEEGFTQNRELSWLRYDERILEEALDESVPLLERLNYIAIFVSNLEEFIQVRVGSLISDNDDFDDLSGMTGKEQLDAVYREIRRLIRLKDDIYNLVENKLNRKGIVRVIHSELMPDEKAFLSRKFHEELKPVISYSIFSETDEMPFIDQNKSYIFTKLNTETDPQYALVDIPSKIDHLTVLNDGLNEGKDFRYILTEDIIKNNLSSLFSPFEPIEVYTIDIARNAEIELKKAGNDQLKNMKKLSEMRKTAAPDKLIIDRVMSDETAVFFMDAFDLEGSQIFVTDRIDYSYVSELENHIPENILKQITFEKFQPFNQLQLGHGSMIERLRNEEIIIMLSV